MPNLLRYIDLPGCGAATGVQRFVFDQKLSNHSLSFIFVYGSNHEELDEARLAAHDRCNIANEFPEERTYFDGFSMAARYVIASILKTPESPGILVDVEIYPPFGDPAEQAAKLSELHTYMELADTADKPIIVSTMTTHGFAHMLE